jgi:hypothetical protein
VSDQPQPAPEPAQPTDAAPTEAEAEAETHACGHRWQKHFGCARCAEDQGQLVAHNVEVLGDLRDMALGLTRRVYAQAQQAERVEPADTKMFNDLAKTVRLTAAMQLRLAEGPLSRASHTAALSGADVALRKRRRLMKDEVRKLISVTIEGSAELRERERLFADLEERLDDPDFEAQLGHKSPVVLVAEIADLLNLKIDMTHWRDHDIAAVLEHFDTEGIYADRVAYLRGPRGWAGGLDGPKRHRQPPPEPDIPKPDPADPPPPDRPP